MGASRTHKLGVLTVKINIYGDYIKLNNRRSEEYAAKDLPYVM
jgi:hypothetical protein